MNRFESFNLLIFGDEDCVHYFCNKLGFNLVSKSGIVYFEFPNTNFKDKRILDSFPYKLKIFVAQEALLNTIITPRQQFRNIDTIVIIYSHFNSTLQNDCFEYLKKFIITTEFVPPILTVALNFKEEYVEKWADSYFYRGIEFTKTLNEIFGCKTLFMDLVENEESNYNNIFSRLIDLLALVKENHKSQLSPLFINKMIQKLRVFLIHLEDKIYTNEEKIYLLGSYENILKIRITRRLLNKKWGLRNKCSKEIMDKWEEIPEFTISNEDQKNELLYKAQEKLRKCEQMNLNLNLINLLLLGESLENSKKYLKVLVDSGIIKSVACHIISMEYKVFDNLQDLIILHKGRTIYIRSSRTSDDEVNLFIGLIQTIEIVRNNYLSDKKELKRFIKVSNVEFLDFGDLHALIGNTEGRSGGNIKIILRFREHPQQIYIDKTKKFLNELELNLPKSLNESLVDLNEIKPFIDKLYYKYFNPFPEKASFDKEFSVSDVVDEKIKKSLTNLENLILNEVKSNKKMFINHILLQIQNKYKIAKSDVLQIIFDLIEENYLI
ncbi:MAG: hypothetical protein ACTSRZ_12850 [Promethearchaeota archaeon]